MQLNIFTKLRSKQAASPKKIRWGRIAAYFFLTSYAVVIILPFIWLFVTSLKDMGQFYSTDLKTVWFPWPLHWSNYKAAVTKVHLLRYLGNSLWLAITQTFLAVSSSIIVAYGFARFQFKGREALFMIVIASMMLPVQVTNIPLFLFFRKLGWLNSFKPLIIPTLFGSAWNIFLIRQFMLGLPKELDESAEIDGCNSFMTLIKVIIPQCIPVIVVVSLFTFLWSWKDLWGPMVYISNSKLYTLPVGLLFFESPTDFQYTMQMAAAVIALIPTVLFYILGQRYLEKGINIAELK